ncbi:MAG: chromate efflux transporter [Woeseia sp.]
MPNGEPVGGPSKTSDRRLASVFSAFLKLGLTSFGGPVAHLGYFHEEFVSRRRWIAERDYADLVALCQFLPGPASSQVGIGIGISRAGLAGGLAAWLAFTTPSALLLIAFGYGVVALGDTLSHDWLHGLKVVAVAVVAQALTGMARVSCADVPRATIAVIAAVVILVSPAPIVQIGVIVAGGIAGWMFLRAPLHVEDASAHVRGSTRRSVIALSLFALLLVALPLLASKFPNQALLLIDSFYRTGSLVFGGGHVVLPLLQSEVVPSNWVSEDQFLAGYGAAQAVPGPLFTFAAYLGTVMQQPPNGWSGALICLTAIFLPSIFLVYGALPIWDSLRHRKATQSASLGINAAVVGLLLAAFYDPVWTSAIRSAGDFGLAVIAFLMLTFWKLPPWLVVIATAAGGAGLQAFR